MQKEYILKYDLRFLVMGLIVAILGFVGVKTIVNARAATGLSGQYGCITNKNFSGFSQNRTWEAGQSTTDTTGNNYLLYFDFDASTSSINVVGATKWGSSGVQGSEVGGDGLPMSVAAGPIKNSYIATTTITVNGITYVTKYNLMPVNSSNTLLLQESTKGNSFGEPNTGMCNKV